MLTRELLVCELDVSTRGPPPRVWLLSGKMPERAPRPSILTCELDVSTRGPPPRVWILSGKMLGRAPVGGRSVLPYVRGGHVAATVLASSAAMSISLPLDESAAGLPSRAPALRAPQHEVPR
eukprot:CAMPEP_0179878024 /NCGR_PEP_ID=MMETSP0982-20121206/25092_1 /TAXON_ID=483367 /ORGANISM="non described non described, Strain CCMP 2436" /LENGTH=121 /DNA_ID=CAMNT_0021770641 /DNA_START=766 /DNA_END=1127 /DNA_ORIENTATION=-